MTFISTLAYNPESAFPLTENAISDIVRWSQSGNIDDVHKLIEYYRSYHKALLQRLNTLCLKFDSSADDYAMALSYSVNTEAGKADCERLYLWAWLYFNYLQQGPDKNLKYDLINVIGRFTLSYIDSQIFKKEESDNIKDIIYSLIGCLVAFDWNFEEIQYMKLTLLNMLLLSGVKEYEEIYGYIGTVISDVKAHNQELFYCLDELIKSYASFFSNPQSGQPLCPDWFYAVIYKKRFGFILCKKIRPKNNLQFSAIAYSPCFLPPYKREITLNKQAIIFKKGENRRCKDYLPPEDTAYYNFATMQFE